VKRSSLVERAVMGLTRLIAGPERRHWIEAMEAELAHLPERPVDWALGSLVAAVKDKAWRERPLAAALAVLPALGLFTMVPLTVLAGMLARALGEPTLTTAPLVGLAPLPAALLLGALRPRSSAWLSGACGWLIYQSIPAVALPLLTNNGIPGYFWWAPNLSPFGVFGPSAVVLTLAFWIGGSVAGARWARTRKGSR
jgi:hypothetical protein